jgi:DNA-binding MarR family transcriptional regulator
VLGTLEGRGLLKRTKSKADGRLVLVQLTPAGRKMMDILFPEFNHAEQFVVETLATESINEVALHLREITVHLEPK